MIETSVKKILEQGIEQGLERGKVYGVITMCRSLGTSDEAIIQKLYELFRMDEFEAKMYLDEKV